MHAGSGLLNNDAYLFHLKAIEIANEIKEYGWEHWTPWIDRAYTGSVATLTVLYVYFKPDPALLIPVNAALHATSGLMIFLIGRIVWPGRVGFYAGLIASVLFIAFPSALNWYAQIHKDSYSIAGLLIYLYSWLIWVNNKISTRNNLIFFMGNLLACLLIIYVRPHIIQLLIPTSLLMFCLLIIHWVLQKKITKEQLFYRFINSLLIIVLLIIITASIKNIYSVEKTVFHFNETIAAYWQRDQPNWSTCESEAHLFSIKYSKQFTPFETITLKTNNTNQNKNKKINCAVIKNFQVFPKTGYEFLLVTDTNQSLNASITLSDGIHTVTSPIRKGKQQHILSLTTAPKTKKITLNLLNGTLINTSHPVELTFSQFKYPFKKWQWTRTDWLPDAIENKLFGMSALRASFIGAGKNADSNIDKNIMPADVYEMFAHFPRTLQVALFAPFPDTWLDKLSIPRLVGVVEIMIWYLIVPGILIALYYRPSINIALILTFSLTLLLINGYLTTNLGTLHRIRYPYLFLLIIIGLSGWLKIIYPSYKAWNEKKT